MMFKGLLKEISRISTESFHLTEFGDTILKSYPEALEKMHVPPSMCFPLINFVLVFFFFVVSGWTRQSSIWPSCFIVSEPRICLNPTRLL